MKIAVMQPYIFPYIGYWQLINAVEKFVILDDVNYIVRGYINRNCILLNGKPYRFTIPIEKASQNKLIMETRLNFTQDKKRDFLLTVHNAYMKAPNYDSVMPLIESIINNKERELTAFIKFSFEKIMEYLNIQTEILCSSKIKKGQGLKGEERIIEICKKLGADVYVNPCGGRKLYQKEKFKKENIELLFLDTCTNEIVYRQNQETFEKNLSIIDILFFNKIDDIRFFLDRYCLNSH